MSNPFFDRAIINSPYEYPPEFQVALDRTISCLTLALSTRRPGTGGTE